MGCKGTDGTDNMEKDGAGQRDRHGQQGTGGHGRQGDGRARGKGTDADNRGGGMETGGKSRPRHRKQKARSAEAERVVGTVGSPTPGGRSGGTERQPFLIEAISWAGVACR